MWIVNVTMGLLANQNADSEYNAENKQNQLTFISESVAGLSGRSS